MTSFSERLDQLLKKSGTPYSEIFKETGISSGNLSNYKSGRVKPSYDAIVALSDFFQVSTDWLLKGIGPDPEQTNANNIPLFGHIATDSKILNDDQAEFFIELPVGITADFACRVTGNNMKFAGICDGDLAFLRNIEPLPDQIIATHKTDESSTISLHFLIKKNNPAVLRSANPDYEDILLTAQDHTDGILVALLKKEVFSLNDYVDLLHVQNDTNKIWSDIKTLALTNNIPAEFVKQLIEQQITMSHILPNLKKKK